MAVECPGSQICTATFLAQVLCCFAMRLYVNGACHAGHFKEECVIMLIWRRRFFPKYSSRSGNPQLSKTQRAPGAAQEYRRNSVAWLARQGLPGMLCRCSFRSWQISLTTCLVQERLEGAASLRACLGARFRRSHGAPRTSGPARRIFLRTLQEA